MAAADISCIDIGANLTNKRFRNDIGKVLGDAQAAGVSAIILTGTSEGSSRHASQMCLSHPGYLYSTAGVHPHDASKYEADATTENLKSLLDLDHVVAVGECGLDFNRDFSPRDQQRTAFLSQLELAADCRLPLFLHERDAFDEFQEMMDQIRERVTGGVVHCFTGTAKQAKSYLDLDLHIGITGWICDERRGLGLRELVRLIPADRLMIETDSPYLAPRDYRPKISRNEPKYLPHILAAVAQCRGVSPKELAKQLMTTTSVFFGIAADEPG